MKDKNLLFHSPQASSNFTSRLQSIKEGKSKLKQKENIIGFGEPKTERIGRKINTSPDYPMPIHSMSPRLKNVVLSVCLIYIYK